MPVCDDRPGGTRHTGAQQRNTEPRAGYKEGPAHTTRRPRFTHFLLHPVVAVRLARRGRFPADNKILTPACGNYARVRRPGRPLIGAVGTHGRREKDMKIHTFCPAPGAMAVACAQKFGPGGSAVGAANGAQSEVAGGRPRRRA